MDFVIHDVQHTKTMELSVDINTLVAEWWKNEERRREIEKARLWFEAERPRWLTGE